MLSTILCKICGYWFFQIIFLSKTFKAYQDKDNFNIPKNTSKEFIKCRILHFLKMECCKYLVIEVMKFFKTLPACSLLFIYFRKY